MDASSPPAFLHHLVPSVMAGMGGVYSGLVASLPGQGTLIPSWLPPSIPRHPGSTPSLRLDPTVAQHPPPLGLSHLPALLCPTLLLLTPHISHGPILPVRVAA